MEKLRTDETLMIFVANLFKIFFFHLAIKEKPTLTYTKLQYCLILFIRVRTCLTRWDWTCSRIGWRGNCLYPK